MVMTLRECHEGMKDLARHLMAELGALTPMIVGFEKYTDRRWVFAVSVASPEERRMSIDETRDRLAEHNCDRYSMIDTDRLIAALPELLVLGVLSTGVAYALQAVAQQFTSDEVDPELRDLILSQPVARQGPDTTELGGRDLMGLTPDRRPPYRFRFGERCGQRGLTRRAPPRCLERPDT